MSPRAGLLALLLLANVCFITHANKSCDKPKIPKLDEHGCTSNETYVNCGVKCPDIYCPMDDSPQPVCDPPMNCPPGCRCKINYKIGEKGNCILASECPPIKCTRQNEVYNSCPPECQRDSCSNRNEPETPCYTLLLNCQPQCVCREGTYRNKEGVCVEPCECDD